MVELFDSVPDKSYVTAHTVLSNGFLKALDLCKQELGLADKHRLRHQYLKEFVPPRVLRHVKNLTAEVTAAVPQLDANDVEQIFHRLMILFWCYAIYGTLITLRSPAVGDIFDPAWMTLESVGQVSRCDAYVFLPIITQRSHYQRNLRSSCVFWRGRTSDQKHCVHE